MRKTKRRKKISKFTYKKKAGMLRLRSVLGLSPTRTITITPIFKIEDAFQILVNITSLILNIDYHDMVHIKNKILRMTSIVKELSNSDKIAFINRVNTTFNEFHNRDPAGMELYFTQIITTIEVTLSVNFLSIESMRLAKLSHDSMIMLVKVFEAPQSTPTTLTTTSMMPMQTEDSAFAIINNIAFYIAHYQSHDMNFLKNKILKMTALYKNLSTSDKIEFINNIGSAIDNEKKFINTLNDFFARLHDKNPVVMELYFTQIITIIDTMITINYLSRELPELAQLALLSHNTMKMMVKVFEASPSEMSPRLSLLSSPPPAPEHAPPVRLSLPPPTPEVRSVRRSSRSSRSSKGITKKG